MAQKNTVDRFIGDVLTNYGRTDKAGKFKLLFFNECLLGNDGLRKMCNVVLQSPRTFALETLFLSNDPSLGDAAIALLFECVESKLVNLKMICLRDTAITDAACDVIYEFYERHSKHLCDCKGSEEKTEPTAKRPTLKLNNINISSNEGITVRGIRRLNRLFFIDAKCDVPHRESCWFHSLAIATSVCMGAIEGDKLSSRFRFTDRKFIPNSSSES